MSEISKSPAGARRTKAPQVSIVLTLSQVKRLRGRLIDLANSGEPITEEALLPVAKQVLRKSVRRSDASSVLTQVGYKRTASQAPMADEHGAIAFTSIWKMPAAPRLVSAAQKAQHLAQRMSELSELVVTEMLDDSQTVDVPLAAKAAEAARVFALKLGEAVMARAPHGGRAVLASCAEVSAITFRSV